MVASPHPSRAHACRPQGSDDSAFVPSSGRDRESGRDTVFRLAARTSARPRPRYDPGVRRRLLSSLLLVACTSSAPPPSESSHAPTKTAEGVVAPSDAASDPPGHTPTTPSYEVLQRACKAPCAGGLGAITVLRDEAGQVGAIRIDGDLQTCSHPPRVYLDAEGNERLTIPNRPVVPGSAEAEAFAAQQAELSEGLHEAESLSCTDPAMCEPQRTEGFRSQYRCRSQDDCTSCQCQPIDRPEWDRRGRDEACIDPDAECIATNPVCCDGRCMLAR